MADQDPDQRWKALCREAQNEKDSKKLMALVCEIEKELEKQDAQKPHVPSKPSRSQ